MCGIAGLIGVPLEQARPAGRRMLAALGHRGPDGRGLVEVAGPPGRPPAVLAHARLAILDLSAAGDQPMTLGGNTIVFNGEVYNFADLQRDLAAEGLACHTTGDTEVILLAYRRWGVEAVHRMRGMFAWALADPAADRVWLCRDRLGIKPLYIARPAGGGLLFASEVRALLAAGPELVPARLDPQAVESFLAQGAVYGPGTIVAGVRSLASGESVLTDWLGREISRQRYWSLSFPSAGDSSGDRPAAVEELAVELRTAARLHLISDRPLGVFLSAGVDSTAVATVAAEQAGRLVTVSVGFDQPEFDETEPAGRIAAELGTDHRTVRLTGPEVVADLPRLLRAVDQPTVDGFNTFVVSRAARRAGLTVALSGLGGDELFGGYASFRDVPRAGRLVKRAGGRVGRGLLAAAGSLVGGRRGVKLAELFRRPDRAAYRYLLRRELFLPADRRRLGPLPAGCDPWAGLPAERVDELDAAGAGLDPWNQVSAFELTGYMREMLLRDSDVFSMATGLELRVPLLDHGLVEAAVRLPGAWKRPGSRPKPLLCDAVGPKLSAIPQTAPKRGFTFPWGPWLRGPLAGHAAEVAADRKLWDRVGFQPDGVAAVHAAFAAGRAAVSPLQALGLVVLGDYVACHRLSL